MHGPPTPSSPGLREKSALTHLGHSSPWLQNPWAHTISMGAWRSQAKCSPSSRHSLNTDGRNECSTQKWRLLEWSLRAYWYFWTQETNKCFLNKRVTTWSSFAPGTTCKQGVWTEEVSWEVFTITPPSPGLWMALGCVYMHAHTWVCSWTSYSWELGPRPYLWAWDRLATLPYCDTAASEWWFLSSGGSSLWRWLWKRREQKLSQGLPHPWSPMGRFIWLHPNAVPMGPAARAFRGAAGTGPSQAAFPPPYPMVVWKGNHRAAIDHVLDMKEERDPVMPWWQRVFTGHGGSGAACHGLTAYLGI